MARTLRMPSETELPRGPVRDFVAELFGLYREARRPTLRQISEAIRKRDDLAGTASTETVRRMLRGTTVPSHWPAVEAVLIVLCSIAGKDPDEVLQYDESWASRKDTLESAWHRALDDPHGRYGAPAENPWATGDDAPF